MVLVVKEIMCQDLPIHREKPSVWPLKVGEKGPILSFEDFGTPRHAFIGLGFEAGGNVEFGGQQSGWWWKNAWKVWDSQFW